MKYTRPGALLTTLLMGIFTATPLMAMTDIGKPGELHFTITIKQPTCEFVKQNMEVDMGTMSIGQGQKTGDTLNSRPFSVDLDDCGGVVRAYVKMDGDADATDNKLFALSGRATGVALKIVNSRGEQELPYSTAGGDGVLWNLTANQPNKLAFVASYVLTSAVRKTGNAEAMVNLSITYE